MSQSTTPHGQMKKPATSGTTVTITPAPYTVQPPPFTVTLPPPVNTTVTIMPPSYTVIPTPFDVVIPSLADLRDRIKVLEDKGIAV